MSACESKFASRSSRKATVAKTVSVEEAQVFAAVCLSYLVLVYFIFEPCVEYCLHNFLEVFCSTSFCRK